MTDKPKRRNASVHQLFAMEKLLEQHFDREKGVYREDWNDDKIAQAVAAETSEPLTIHSVRGLRLKTGRALKVVTPKAAPAAGPETTERVVRRVCAHLGLSYDDLAAALV